MSLLILSLLLLSSSSVFDLVFDMEGDVVLLGLMDWNAGSTATQLIPLPTTNEMCYELLTGGVCIYIYIETISAVKRIGKGRKESNLLV